MEMIPLIAIFMGVFYFLMIRPEQKRKKQKAEMMDALQVGDNITTIGGMVGKVVRVRDDLVTFETGEDRVRIQIMKWAIANKGLDKTETAQQDQPSAQ
ncbi:MAG: preprotein translocase subunit YajC [Oscillospiraceae bacterium]|nr:preprotein translocase subunit YajC [Oscillospiraceae bacterium]